MPEKQNTVIYEFIIILRDNQFEVTDPIGATLFVIALFWLLNKYEYSNSIETCS